MSVKLHTAFKALTHADFLARAESILSSLANHPLVSEPIPEPFPSLAKLKEITDAYRESYYAAVNGDRVKISQRDLLRPRVEEEFVSLAAFLTQKAGKDQFMLVDLGFEVRERAAKSTHVSSSLVAPSNVTAKHGELPSVIILRCSRTYGTGSYEVQISEGDSSVEENWRPAGHYMHASRMEVKGLEPGRRYSFRLRSIGPDGPGPWSAIVSLICM